MAPAHIAVAHLAGSRLAMLAATAALLPRASTVRDTFLYDAQRVLAVSQEAGRDATMTKECPSLDGVWAVDGQSYHIYVQDGKALVPYSKRGGQREMSLDWVGDCTTVTADGTFSAGLSKDNKLTWSSKGDADAVFSVWQRVPCHESSGTIPEGLQINFRLRVQEAAQCRCEYSHPWESKFQEFPSVMPNKGKGVLDVGVCSCQWSYGKSSKDGTQYGSLGSIRMIVDGISYTALFSKIPQCPQAAVSASQPTSPSSGGGGGGATANSEEEELQPTRMSSAQTNPRSRSNSPEVQVPRSMPSASAKDTDEWVWRAKKNYWENKDRKRILYGERHPDERYGFLPTALPEPTAAEAKSEEKESNSPEVQVSMPSASAKDTDEWAWNDKEKMWENKDRKRVLYGETHPSERNGDLPEPTAAQDSSKPKEKRKRKRNKVGKTTTIPEGTSPGAKFIFVKSMKGLVVSDVVEIADGTNNEVRRIAGITEEPYVHRIELNRRLDHAYTKGAAVYKADSN